MGVPEANVKQKMTMDGLDWQKMFGADGSRSGAPASRSVITANALCQVKLKNSKKRKLVRRCYPLFMGLGLLLFGS